MHFKIGRHGHQVLVELVRVPVRQPCAGFDEAVEIAKELDESLGELSIREIIRVCRPESPCELFDVFRLERRREVVSESAMASGLEIVADAGGGKPAMATLAATKPLTSAKNAERRSTAAHGRICGEKPWVLDGVVATAAWS